MSETYILFRLIFVLFIIVLVILWILMPFAIFGTKDKLQILIDEAKETNKLLKEINIKK